MLPMSLRPYESEDQLMNVAPLAINDEGSATRFIAWCVERVGLGYHPDTPFSDYTTDGGARCFSDDEASVLDAATEVAFRFCDPYDAALSAARSSLMV